MNRKIIHPLWAHIPSFLSFLALIVSIIVMGPFPSSVPVHFGMAGVPDRYGSPWEVFGISIALSVLFIALSVFLDELWARQEKKKAFNFLSLLDDIVVGSMAGFTIGFMDFINSGAEMFTYPWTWFIIVTGSSTVLAIILELMRPFRPSLNQISSGESTALKTEISDRLKKGSPFVYWDIQNPGYINLITVILPLILIAAAAFSWTSQIWVSVILIIVGLLMVIPNGGQRVMVTPDAVTIRWGILGLKVLTLDMNSIAGAELHEFSALKDFGGYGIRFNREMKAYFLRGSLGVRIETAEGKKYLIGSDQPEHLYTILHTMLEKR